MRCCNANCHEGRACPVRLNQYDGGARLHTDFSELLPAPSAADTDLALRLRAVQVAMLLLLLLVSWG
jgi:hypothetical protein